MTREELEVKIHSCIRAGDQMEYDRMDNLVPIYNYSEVAENVLFLLDAYVKQQATAFSLHVVGQIKVNPERKHFYDADSNESFLITLPSKIDKLYDTFSQTQDISK